MKEAKHSIIAAVVLYLMFSFMMWSLNPVKWETEGRVGYIAAVFVITVAIFNVSTEMKNNE